MLSSRLGFLGTRVGKSMSSKSISADTPAAKTFFEYMAAVRMPSNKATRSAKLHAIVETFSEDCVIDTSDGRRLTGKAAVHAFYDNVMEMANDNFGPLLVEESISYAPSGRCIAAEVHLPQINKYVGDFWYFNDAGKIDRLVVYAKTG